MDIVYSVQFTAANIKIIIKNKNYILFYLFQRQEIIAEKIYIKYYFCSSQFIQYIINLSANSYILYYKIYINCFINNYKYQYNLYIDFEKTSRIRVVFGSVSGPRSRNRPQLAAVSGSRSKTRPRPEPGPI